MYTYETAMGRLPESARQAGPRGDTGIASAFREFERRGASSAEWETLITRISNHYEGVSPPKFDGAFRDRVGGMIEDPDFRSRVLALLS